MDALRELLAIFDIEVDPKGSLEKGDKKVEGFAKKLGEIAKTVGEAFAVEQVYEFVKSQVEAAAHVQDLAERLDISATSISNFGFVAKGAGIDLDSAARSLGILEKNLGEASSKGGASAAAFAKLHVSLKNADGSARNTNDVLGDLAEGISKLPDHNERAALSMELLGREGKAFVPIFSKGRDAMLEALKAADELGNGLGDSYFADAKKAREESEQLGRAIQSLKERAIAIVLPYVTSFVEMLKEAAKWSLEHAKTTQVLEYAVGALAIAVGVALTDALWSAAVALWALLAPILPFVAAAGALVWVFQDLAGAIHGDDSAIADLIGTLGGLEAKTAFVNALGQAWEELKGDVNGVLYALGYFVGIWMGVGKAIKESWEVAALGMLFQQLGIDIGGANTAGGVLLGTLRLIKEGIIAMIPGFDLLRNVGEAIALAHGHTFAPDATAYGATPAAVAAAAPGPWADPSKHPAGPRQPTSIVRNREPTSMWRGAEPTAPHVGGGIAPARLPAPHGGGLTVNLHNENKIVVHPVTDKPREHAEAIGSGVATATQKDMRNALTSVVRK